MKRNPKEHGHLEGRRDSIVLDARMAMKSKAIREPDLSLKRVYSRVLIDTMRDLASTHDSEEIANALPNFEATRSSIQRARAKVRLEGVWTSTIEGEPFLIVNDGAENKILGFSAPQALQI